MVTIKLKRSILNTILNATLSEGEIVYSYDTGEVFVEYAGVKNLIGRCLDFTSDTIPQPGLKGRLIYESDTGSLYFDDGTQYILLNPVNEIQFKKYDRTYINSVLDGSVNTDNFPNFLTFNSQTNVVSLNSNILVNISGFEYTIQSGLTTTISNNQVRNFILLKRIDDENFTLTSTTRKPLYSYQIPNNQIAGDYWYDLKESKMKLFNGSSYSVNNSIELGYIEQNNVICYSYKNRFEYIIYATRNTLYQFNPRLPKTPDYVHVYQNDNLNNNWAMIDGSFITRPTGLIQEISYDYIRYVSGSEVFSIGVNSSYDRTPSYSNNGYIKFIMECKL